MMETTTVMTPTATSLFLLVGGLHIDAIETREMNIICLRPLLNEEKTRISS